MHRSTSHCSTSHSTSAARRSRRALALCAVGLLLACSSNAVGAACEQDVDCGDGLICDIHGPIGTCQEAHTHDPVDAHRHDVMPVALDTAIPSVTLSASADPAGGWNLQLHTTDFELTAPSADDTARDPSLVRGHAHLFVDGRKTTRLYGSWYYLPSLGRGEHELRVELASDDHQVLWYGGSFIEDRLSLTEGVGASAEDGPGMTSNGAQADELEVDVDVDVAIEVIAEPGGGYDLRVQARGITLGPMLDGVDEPRGMLELFIDGEPRGRIYSEWHYLGDLDAGSHELLVRLHDQQRRLLTRGRVPIEASVELEAP